MAEQHPAPRTAAALAEYESVRHDESIYGWGGLGQVSVELADAIMEERVLERLTAAERVVDAARHVADADRWTLHGDDPYHAEWGPCTGDVEALGAALVAYDAIRQGGEGDG